MKKLFLIVICLVYGCGLFAQKKKKQNCNCFSESAITVTGDFGTAFPANANFSSAFSGAAMAGIFFNFNEINLGLGYNVFNYKTDNREDPNVIMSYFVAYTRYILKNKRLGVGTRINYSNAQDGATAESSSVTLPGIAIDITANYKIIGYRETHRGISVFSNYQIFNVDQINYNSLAVGLRFTL